MLTAIGSYSADTAVRGTVFPTIVHAASNPHANVIEKDGGLAIVQGFRIFKHGTFRDSMGIERTWEPLHLDMMAQHFDLLRDNGILPNVPMRKDHSWSIDSVVGYFLRIYRDPIDDLFLASDFEFTEPEAYEKYKRGTFRSRSLEVGMYESNDGATYFPVVMGCAFVDLPAVEGLHSVRRSGPGFHGIPEPTKEQTVNPDEWIKAANYAQALADWERAANYAKAVEDWEKAARYAAALEHHQQTAVALGLQSDTPVNHGLPGQSQNFVFRVNGQPTTDFNAVQAHIATLESAEEATTQAVRQEFVDGLEQGNIITSKQAEEFRALVKTFSADQFAAWKKAYEGAAPNALLQTWGQGEQPGGQGQQQYGFQGNVPPGPSLPISFGQQPKTAEQQLALDKAVVQRLKMSGQPDDRIKKTAEYQRLTAAGQAPF